MIADGRVSIDGKVLTTPAVKLNNLNGVTVDGKAVAQAEAPRLFAFHKPSGLITAERDPKGRPTIYTALRNALPKNAGRVMPVGRLDFNTEGLLLLTNDGEMKRAMELPSSGVPRTYRARAFGDITQADLDTLIEGVEIDEVFGGGEAAGGAGFGEGVGTGHGWAPVEARILPPWFHRGRERMEMEIGASSISHRFLDRLSHRPRKLLLEMS